MGLAVGWGPTFLSALYLEEAHQDTECGGQLYPGSVSGSLIDCGVRALQEGLVWGQGFCHTAYHHGHDSKGACRDPSGHVSMGEDTALPWSPDLKREARRRPVLDKCPQTTLCHTGSAELKGS